MGKPSPKRRFEGMRIIGIPRAMAPKEACSPGLTCRATGKSRAPGELKRQQQGHETGQGHEVTGKAAEKALPTKAPRAIHANQDPIRIPMQSSFPSKLPEPRERGGPGPAGHPPKAEKAGVEPALRPLGADDVEPVEVTSKALFGCGISGDGGRPGQRSTAR